MTVHSLDEFSSFRTAAEEEDQNNVVDVDVDVDDDEEMNKEQHDGNENENESVIVNVDKDDNTDDNVDDNGGDGNTNLTNNSPTDSPTEEADPSSTNPPNQNNNNNNNNNNNSIAYGSDSNDAPPVKLPMCGMSCCLCTTMLLVMGMALILPIVALLFVYRWYNDGEQQQEIGNDEGQVITLLNNDVCDDAADWMEVLAWFQIVVVVCMVLLQFWTLRQMKQHSSTSAPSVSPVALFCTATLYFLVMAFQLAWLIYGAILLTGHRDEYNSDDHDHQEEASCEDMALFAQIYCWLSVAGVICNCRRQNNQNEQDGN